MKRSSSEDHFKDFINDENEGEDENDLIEELTQR